jgi:hypothetical protein
MTALEDILGVLSGRPVNRDRAMAEAFANQMLGQAIGAQTDLGLTDEQILAHCQKVLAMIRRALTNPAAIANLKNAVDQL